MDTFFITICLFVDSTRVDQPTCGRTCFIYILNTHFSIQSKNKKKLTCDTLCKFNVILGIFSLVGYESTTIGGGCSTAYVEVYNATDTGVLISPPLIGPVCGTQLPGYFYCLLFMNDFCRPTNDFSVRLSPFWLKFFKMVILVF